MEPAQRTAGFERVSRRSARTSVLDSPVPSADHEVPPLLVAKTPTVVPAERVLANVG